MPCQIQTCVEVRSNGSTRAWNLFLGPIALFLPLLLASCASTPRSTAEGQVEAESAIRKIEQDWAETAVTGDTPVIERILADDFVGTSPEGLPYMKQDFLKDMKAHPSEFTANQVNDVKIRFFDNVAVAHGNETFTRKSGEMGRFVWTDVLVKREGKWQIVAAEDLIAPVGTQESSGLFLNGSSTGGKGEGRRDLDEIKKTRTASVSAWKTGSAATVANSYTKDALVLYPNQPPVVGHAAILDYFRGFFAEFREQSFELISAEVRVAGTLAFDRGVYRLKGVPRGGGLPAEDHGKYLVILERQSDGSWKVAGIWIIATCLLHNERGLLGFPKRREPISSMPGTAHSNVMRNA